MSYRNDAPLRTANLRIDYSRLAVKCRLKAPELPAGEREISWLGRAPSGENQVADGPCGIYATASVIESAQRTRIVDAERREAYSYAIRHAGRKAGDGLTIEECVDAAVQVGWLPAGSTAEPCDAEMILMRPLVGAYAVNRVIDESSPRGCWNHSDGAIHSPMRGYHAMSVLAYGHLDNDPVSRWVGENSWGSAWGDHGLWTCYDVLHRQMCIALYYIRGLEVVP